MLSLRPNADLSGPLWAPITVKSSLSKKKMTTQRKGTTEEDGAMEDELATEPLRLAGSKFTVLFSSYPTAKAQRVRSYSSKKLESKIGISS